MIVSMFLVLGIIALVFSFKWIKEPIDPLEYSEEQYKRMREEYRNNRNENK